MLLPEFELSASLSDGGVSLANSNIEEDKTTLVAIEIKVFISAPLNFLYILLLLGKYVNNTHIFGTGFAL
jgi:hypothetical protein